MDRVKILFVHNQLVCGGAEQALYDLVSLMDREKFDITILALHPFGQWYDKFCATGVRVMDPWTCQRYSPNPFVKLWNKYIGLWILRSLRRDGRDLVRHCIGEKFDIVVSYSVWDLQYAGLVPGAKTLKFIHGDMATNPEFAGGILNAMELMEKFDRFVCVSHGAAESFARMTGLGDRMAVHYNPIDSDRIRTMAQEKLELPEDLPLVCAVGRLCWEKGFDRLIRIHSHLLKEGLVHRLVIVGEGKEREKLEQIIAEEKVQDTVILAGYSENPYPYMKKSRFLVSSSHTEALPVVAMEALILGLPIIASVPSVGEIFGDEKCGLITGDDDEALENGLRKVLGDEAFYAELKAGAESRGKYFEGKRMVREIEEEFLDLLK